MQLEVISMKVHINYTLLLLSLLLFVPLAHGAISCLEIEGLSNELKRKIYTRLFLSSSTDITACYSFQPLIEQTIREELRVVGYYSPIIDFKLYPDVNNSHNILVTHINPGQPVKIARIKVTLRGDAYEDNTYQQLVNHSKILVGTILNHSDYDNFKRSFSNIALQKGYFDAHFCISQLGVSPERYQAYWNIDFDSGKRHRFGKVRFQGAQIREDYLQSLSTVQDGYPYSTESLTELNRRLAATNWFNSIVISPDFKNSKKSKIIPLDAVLTPRSRNNIETSVGYANDIGHRIKLTWHNPWLNSCGHSLESSINLSVPEQTAYLSYKLPLLKAPLEQYYLLQGRCKHEYLNDTQSYSSMLNIARYWDSSSGWQRAFNLHRSLDHFTQAHTTNTTMLIYPGASINRTRQRGGLMPTWGDSQRYSVDFSNTTWGSDINFVILQAQIVWVRTLAYMHRFVVRSNLGWIETDCFERIPPSLRFFIGGDRSIRGYKYKSLSPRDQTNKLIGASILATWSLEYQYNVVGKWWSTIFFDNGEAVNNIKQGNFKIGAGVGVRWQSPVGPIKLDIALPVNDKDARGLQFYIGLGSEL